MDFRIVSSIGIRGKPSSLTALEQSYHSRIRPILTSLAVTVGTFFVKPEANSKRWPKRRARS